MSGLATRPSEGRLTGWRVAGLWLGVAAAAALLILASVSGASPEAALLTTMLILPVVGSFGIVGAIVVTRRPRNPIGWIVWTTGIAIAASITGNSYVTISVQWYGGDLPLTVPIAVLAQADLVPLLGAVGIFLPLLFPNGHLPSPRWRWVAGYAASAVAVATAISLVTPGPLSGGSDIPNPLGVEALAGAEELLGLVMGALLAPPFVLAVASVVVRFRHAGRDERQQLKWFAGSAVVMVASVAVGSSGIGPLAEGGWLLMIAGLGLLPVAIGVAVLRYRLYEIDRIVSRAIAYLVVTGVLAAVFVGVVILFTAVLSPALGENPVAVAAATLVVAAVFQPLRRRVQSVVDRRFNRARYDAERTADAFAGRLRDQVDLAPLRADLLETVAGTLDPSRLTIWLRDPGGTR